MKMKTIQSIIMIMALCALISCNEKVQQSSSNEYEFIGGYPTKATIEKAYNQLDVQRATQVYMDFMSLASQNAIFESIIRELDLTKAGDVSIFTEPGKGKSESIGLTYNTESVYSSAFTDLKTDGPTVVETPPNVLGIVDDGWMRFITDLGNAGPDKGKGGKYLLLPPGYDGDVPEGYFVFECPTYRNWIMVRGFVEDTGTGDDAITYYKDNFKIYPLATGPREDAKYESASFNEGNTTHPRDISYFNLIDKIVQYEPSSAFSAYELGLLKAIGVEKGKEFSPDERMKILYLFQYQLFLKDLIRRLKRQMKVHIVQFYRLN